MSNAVVYTEQSLPAAKRDSGDKPRERLMVTDPVTESLGATFYIEAKSFDGIREVLYGRRAGDVSTGNKIRFSRWYPEIGVLVDLFNVDTDGNRKKAEQRSRIIAEYNKAQKSADAKFGYLPIMTGNRVPSDSFKRALKKAVLTLPPRPPQLERIMREAAIFVKESE